MIKEDWLKRYRARFAERARGPEDEILSEEFLDDCANAIPFEEASVDFEDDPEGAADEEMSYWEE